LDETNAADDLIEVKGDKIPNSGDATRPVEIQVGLPGVDNSALPDFIIPPAALGADDVTTYGGSRIVINKGAYLNIDTNQTMGESGDSGRFRSGNITVKSGGKVRDSAYSDWPLGAGSTFTVETGAFLAVGPGNSDGAYMKRTAAQTYDPPITDEASCGADPYCPGFIGWLIGPEKNIDSRIQLGGIDANSGQIWVAKSWVYLTGGGYAKIAKYANIYPYNVLVGAHSTVEIAAELETNQGGTQAKFYGVPEAQQSATPEPATFEGSIVKISDGGSVSEVALGFTPTDPNTPDSITTGTYSAVAGGEVATSAPWDSARTLVNKWALPTTP
ncbi:MAG: hypothetical protein LBL41_01315, partial [Bifidobacteriaceae bacterium]|nr:hypothetical protein [Bifidobacteriaceae bacterium]